jgi:hypothetical protein
MTNHDRWRGLRLGLSGMRDQDPSVIEPAVRSAEVPQGNPRFLGEVIDGGAMPSTTDRIFLVHPVGLFGSENEGASAVLAVDGTRTIPVVVIGGAVPTAGDLLLALAVGARWVAEFGRGGALLACTPCSIPRRNLTLSWTNPLLGAGSTTLAFAPPGQWNSPCVNRLLFQLSCTGGSVRLAVTYFVSGDCPGGQSQSCVSPGLTPFAITLDSFSCNPLLLHYTVGNTGCPALWDEGYTAFTITE